MAAVETEAATVRAQAKYVHSSARKARLVTDLIRGRSVPEARTILAFSKRAVAHDVEKVLRSAVANAESRPDLHWNGDDLVVVDGVRRRGPDAQALPRPRARPRVRDPQAHVPHHGGARAERLQRSRRPRPRRRLRRGASALRSRRRRADGDYGRADGGRRAGDDRGEPRNSTGRGDGGANGSEDSSGRTARRRHPRLEVQLVHRQEGVPGVHPRGRPHPRAHLQEARARGAVRHPDPQGQAADHGRHLHRAPGHRHRQVRRRGRRAAQRRCTR